MSDFTAGVPTADREFGEWLYRELIADVHREETGWAPERVERVERAERMAERLQAGCRARSAPVPIVL